MRNKRYLYLAIIALFFIVSNDVSALSRTDFPYISTFNPSELYNGEDFLVVHIDPAGSFEMIDPKYRRLGYDMNTRKVLTGIPSSDAHAVSIDDDVTQIEPPPVWEIYILPIDGKYRLKIFDIPDKKYDLYIRIPKFNETGIRDFLKIPVSKKAIHIFDILIDSRNQKITVIRTQ